MAHGAHRSNEVFSMLRASRCSRCAQLLRNTSRITPLLAPRPNALLEAVAIGARQPARTFMTMGRSSLQLAVFPQASAAPGGFLGAQPRSLLMGPILSVRLLKTVGKHKKGAARAAPRKIPFKKKLKKRFKLKTHQGAKKRFTLLGDGRWVHKASGKRHLQAGSSRHRQTLRKRKKVVVSKTCNIKRLHLLMPYARRRSLRLRPVNPSQKGKYWDAQQAMARQAQQAQQA
jgi:ribosomal protein L35